MKSGSPEADLVKPNSAAQVRPSKNSYFSIFLLKFCRIHFIRYVLSEPLVEPLPFME